MPARKRQPPPAGEGGSILVLVEEMRSQNRPSLEVVQAHHRQMRQDLQDFRGEVQSEFGIVHAAIKTIGGEVQQLKVEVTALKEQVARIDAVITVDYRDRVSA